jgi:serine/threonine-protein kinase SIK2
MITKVPVLLKLFDILLAGIVAFRQHLQNLARTKGILELNKVQLLYEQMGSNADPTLTSTAPQLQDLSSSCPQVGVQTLSNTFLLWMCGF